jgi:hypothetical protein
MLHMVVNLKAHLLKIDKLFSVNQIDVLLKSVQFRVCFLFTVQPFLTHVLTHVL